MRFVLGFIVALAATTGVARAQAPSPTASATQGPQPSPSATAGQAIQLPATVCGLEVPAPLKAPPAGSPTLVYPMLLCFEKQGGTSVIDPATYQYYIELVNR